GDTVRIGRNTERRDAVVDVNVDVDQPRRDDLAARVQDLPRLGLGNARGEAADLVAGDGDVAGGGKALRRIYHAPALHQQIIGRRGGPGLRAQEVLAARGKVIEEECSSCHRAIIG